MPPAIDYVSDFTKSKLPSSMINMTQSLLRLTQAVLVKHKAAVLAHSNQTERLCRYLLAFTLTWSIGGNCDDASRKLFHEYAAKNVLPGLLDAEDAAALNGGPAAVYDVCLDFAGIRFVPWTSLRKDFVFTPGASFFDIMVPTADTTRCVRGLSLPPPTPPHPPCFALSCSVLCCCCFYYISIRSPAVQS